MIICHRIRTLTVYIAVVTLLSLLLLAIGCQGGSAGLYGAVPAPERVKPNCLFILVDQQRQDGVGAYVSDSKVKTPHLDAMAAEGILFNRAYTAQPVCAPNRGSIFSGLMPFNHGVRENTWDLNPKVKLTPHYLKKAGYISGYFGKWHLGDPARKAFDVMPDYPNDGRGKRHYYTINGKKVYQTEVLSKDVIDFMRKNQETPFFAVLSMYPPHTSYSVPARYEKMYQDDYPDDKSRRRYYAMCTAVDDAVGRVLTALKKLDLDKNTLVIYTSEHGHYFDKRWNNHHKRLCYDVSARIPLLMRYPGIIPAGQRSEMLINSGDLTPTLLGLMGHDVPKVDGLNFSAQIRGESKEFPAYTVMVNVPFINKKEKPNQPMIEKGEERAIVHDRYKLILSTVRDPELYDLTADPGETSNLWNSQNRSAVGRMRTHLSEWADRTGDTLAPKLIQKHLIQKSD